MHRFVILIEPTATGYSAFIPDLPGCVAAGATVEQTEARMRAAIAFHVDGMRADGLPVPAPQTTASYVEVAV